MAFQPIYDVGQERVWGYEALIRGLAGEGAADILARVTPVNKYRFDQLCRQKAIALAARLYPAGHDLHLSINFMPNAVYEPAACLRATLDAAQASSFPKSAIMFEFTESERIVDPTHLRGIITEYRKHGFITAIDDFGAGYAGLGLLADFQPDLIKLDMQLIRNIDTNWARQVIVTGIISIARSLKIVVLAEGVESEAEFRALKAAGISLFQGFYFAGPAFEALPPIMAGGAVIAHRAAHSNAA